MKIITSLIGTLLATTVALAQLAVTVSPPKVTGNKAVVKLEMKNGLAERIESVRAACFLADDQNKVVAHSVKWIVGSIGTNGLAVGGTNAFHFVISSDKLLTATNLTANVQINRVVLDGGKIADVAKEVVVNNPVMK